MKTTYAADATEYQRLFYAADATDTAVSRSEYGYSRPPAPDRVAIKIALILILSHLNRLRAQMVAE